MPNASEMARLEEERTILLNQLKNMMYRDKQSKEKVLRELRQVEAALGIEGTAYNSGSFGEG